MSKENKFYRGNIDEITVLDNKNSDLTFEKEKEWLDKMQLWFNDKEFYNEKLIELKKKYNIKD